MVFFEIKFFLNCSRIQLTVKIPKTWEKNPKISTKIFPKMSKKKDRIISLSTHGQNKTDQN